MKGLFFVLLAALALSAAADPQSGPDPEKTAVVDEAGKPERWKLTFDGKPWKLVSADLNGTATIRTYVPESQSLEHSEERLVTEYGRSRKDTPKILFDQFKTGMAKSCPTLEVQLIWEKEDSLLFEWSCGGSLAQHSLKKIVRTPPDNFLISYSRKGRMSPEDKKTWLAILEAAEPQ